MINQKERAMSIKLARLILWCQKNKICKLFCIPLFRLGFNSPELKFGAIKSSLVLACPG